MLGTLRTYNYIKEHLPNTYPATIPAMKKYLEVWLHGDEDIDPQYEEDICEVIYPYLAAHQALIDAGVKNAEKYIAALRTEEVGSKILASFFTTLLSHLIWVNKVM